jgi:hypothetical protein
VRLKSRHTDKRADLFPTVTDSSDRGKIEYRVAAELAAGHALTDYFKKV